MKFIARYLNLIGLILLASFVAAAAGLYFQVPERFQAKRLPAPAAKAVQATVASSHGDVCCAAKAPAPEPPAATCPHLAAQAAQATQESSCCSQPANP